MPVFLDTGLRDYRTNGQPGYAAMTSLQRLKDNEAFQRVYRDGRSWATPLLILRASPNDLPLSRIGYSTSKRIGKAVSRNRVKRLMREAVRAQAACLPAGWDLVLIARESSRAAALSQFQRALEQLLAQSTLCRRAAQDATQ